MQNLNGKVAVITGGASGIGFAMAERFGLEGMRLALADVERAALEEAVSRLTAAGVEVAGFPTDVSKAAEMDALGERVRERFGSVHLLCNNAGVGGGGSMWELTTADWEFVLGVNLWGVIHGIRVFAKQMVEQREGHIVNTASMAGLVSVPGMGPYNVTKHAVVTLSETLYGELKSVDSPVGVSVLCPGFVNTRIYESQRNRPEELRGTNEQPTEQDEKRHEMAARFFAQAMPPSDVANLVADAVENERFYILTHEGSHAGVERRLRTIIAGENPAATNPGIFNRDSTGEDA